MAITHVVMTRQEERLIISLCLEENTEGEGKKAESGALSRSM